MPEQPYFDDVRIGDSIPVLSTKVDRTQMFYFGAATNNAHRIHYDKDWATEQEGYPDILVHGPLQAALMARTLTDWVGPSGRLLRIALQNRASVLPDEEIEFFGKVVDTRIDGGEGLVDLEIREENGQGKIVMPGSATVVLPLRASRENS